DRFTIGEGDTPLIRARRIGREVGLTNLWFKLELTNPTGSYKDRFAASAIGAMIEFGQTECIATSSGNTGAALAACCAAAGIRCRIAVVEGIPSGKLSQMLAYGAEVFRVRDFGTNAAVTDAVFERLQSLAEAPNAALQVSAYVHSPIGMAGVESLGAEIVQQLPETKHIFCPAGGGGLAVATARGTEGVAVHVVQPEGNNTIAGPLRQGLDRAVDVECTSEISGLQVASVVDGHLAIAECRPTGGNGHVVSDERIWEVQQLLAHEGVFCEPAGAVSVAGALQAAADGEVDADEPQVCLITGSGFKDPSAIDRMTASTETLLLNVEEIS
ncbi:MAG: pyridoxal-phosphate dependent enzyme, partial [Verrucomicrobiota bacterium]